MARGRHLPESLVFLCGGYAGAEVLIHDEIGTYGISARCFLAELGALPEGAAIDLRLNSPGGSVFDAVAIHNALSRHAGTVTVWIDGIAASAASYIAMAGDEIVMPENAFLMIHDPSGPVMGNVSRGSGPSTSTTLVKFLNAGNWSLQVKRFCIRTSGSTESYASTNLWLKLPVGCLAQHPPGTYSDADYFNAARRSDDYNTERPHSSLKNQTPGEFAAARLFDKMQWAQPRITATGWRSRRSCRRARRRRRPRFAMPRSEMIVQSVAEESLPAPRSWHRHLPGLAALTAGDTRDGSVDDGLVLEEPKLF